MLLDLLHLSRTLRRSPASAAAAILTLSLTLGAAASILAVVHTVLLTPPPFADPDRLVVAGETAIDDPGARPGRVLYATFEAWRDRVASQAVLEAYEGTNFTLTGLGAAERVSANDVTPGFLSMLGVVPALGRGFAPGDVAQPVVMISHRLWQARLAGDPGVIGRQIVLGNRPYTVVGVLPERFVFELNLADVWRPVPLLPAQARAGYPVAVIARVAQNVSSASLAAALEEVSRTAARPTRVVTVPVATVIAGDATRTLGLLAAAAALAVVIAFANFAGLLIVRSIGRRRELAIRTALGARRSEIVRLVLLEAQALVVLGIAGGVLLALWLTPVVARLALEQFGGVAHREATVSWRVIVFVGLAASICAWVCALLPARTAARRNVVDVLRRGATPAPPDLRSRRVLVAGQVALAFVLLACMTLLGGSLFRLLEVNPGFDPRGVLKLQVSLPRASYPDERVVSFYRTLQSALDERLGSRSTAFINEIPLSGSGGLRLVSVRPKETGRQAMFREVSSSYFEVMRIPVVAGRTFERQDGNSAPLRVVISETLADALLPSEQPIGRQLYLPSRDEMAEVVGVVGDVKHRALDEAPVPTVYLSAMQSPSPSSIVVVRSARPDADVTAAMREEVGRLDGSLPVYGVQSMQEVVARSPGIPARRVLTATFMGFALLAIVLGAIGLFGVAAHDVAARRTELAIRIALGANPMRIVGTTLAHGAVMVGAGLAVGGVLSIWAGRALSRVGFAPEGFNLLSVAVPVAMLIVAGLAAVLPAARRAASTDPLIALRSE